MNWPSAWLHWVVREMQASCLTYGRKKNTRQKKPRPDVGAVFLLTPNPGNPQTLSSGKAAVFIGTLIFNI